MPSHRFSFATAAATVAAVLSLALAAAPPPTLAAQSLSAKPPIFSPPTRLGFAAGDDWEPAITSDAQGHVYALYTHFHVQGVSDCQGCILHMLLQISDDNGRTWGAPTVLAPIPTKGGQFDPQILVDPVDGHTVWASFMDSVDAHIAVMHSSDFGATWSPITYVSPGAPRFDKDEMIVHGQTIAIAYDSSGFTWCSISLNGGQTWAVHHIFTQTKLYYNDLGGGGGIDSHGTLYFSWDSFARAQASKADGPATLWVSISSDNGKTWTRRVIGASGAPPACAQKCGWDFLGPQMALAVGTDDAINVLWNGTSDLTNYAPERIYFERSTDGGQTWSTRQDVSSAPAGVEHCFPSLITGLNAGDVRIAWTDERTGLWNVFYRQSTDGGASWTKEAQISRYVPGYAYLTTKGFGLPYGDYFKMTVDGTGATQIDWGESGSYNTPGNIWAAYEVG